MLKHLLPLLSLRGKTARFTSTSLRLRCEPGVEVALSPERRQPGQGALRLRVWSPAGTGTQRSDLHRGTLANTDPELPTSSQIRKQLTSPRCGEEETEPCRPRHGHLLTGRGATKRPFRRGGGGDGPRLGLVGGGAALKIHEVLARARAQSSVGAPWGPGGRRRLSFRAGGPRTGEGTEQKRALSYQNLL